MKNTDSLLYKLPWIAIILLASVLSIVVMDNIRTGPTVPQNNAIPSQSGWQMMPAPLPTVVPPGPQPQPNVSQAAQQVQEGINQAISLVRPATIAVVGPRQAAGAGGGQGGMSLIKPADGQDGPMCSGLIVTASGYVVTTFQSVGQRKEVEMIMLSGGKRQYSADVVTVDPKTDLALLKIRSNDTFPVAILGDSDFIKTGDLVFAVGIPYGFGRTASMGIVSSSSRQVRINGINYPDLIQTDAAINDGEAGGPLINIRGEVIGINVAYYVPGNHFTGIGFAVPINDAKKLLHWQ